MIDLKKCPFCGGEAEFATSHKRWVMCKECLAEGDYCDTPEQAIAAWNNRKPVEDVLEQIEALKNDFITCMRDSDYLRGNVNFAVNAIEIIKEELN